MAWAPDKGIAKVEVQVDDGPWMTAQLGQVLSKDTWCEWMVPWSATKGQHTLRVRATDKTGYTQTGDQSDPEPNGATGWHTRKVTVVGLSRARGGGTRTRRLDVGSLLVLKLYTSVA